MVVVKLAGLKLSIIHLDLLVLLRELVRGVVSRGAGGPREGPPVGLAGGDPPGATAPGVLGVVLLHVLHGHEFLQRLRRDLLQRLHICLHLLQVALQLGAPVLEPRDDLRVTQAELLRDLVPVRRAQVLLVQEALLQLVDLVVGEGRARLPPLLRGVPLAEQRHPVPAWRIQNTVSRYSRILYNKIKYNTVGYSTI